MHRDLEYVESLVSKFQSGEISPQELKELMTWYNSHPDEQVTIPTIQPLGHEEIKQRMLEGLMSKIRLEDIPTTSRISRMRPWYWAASVAAILLVVTSVWFGLRDMKSPTMDTLSKTAQDSILPGGNKAILMLADGNQVALDTEQQGIVMDGAIHYTDGRRLEQDVDLDEIKDLQLYVPKGGIYQITLADGTQVWLNSDTRLKYPSRFSDTERLVELDGEAFFAVNTVLDKENKRIPFIVKSRGQSVEVVGTQFNINSYSTASFVRTTLLEGSVNIQASDKKVALVPGQQANIEDSDIKVKRVNPSHFIAWKEGKFSFDGRSFEETMAEIGRWYNLTIVYKGKIPDVELVGDAYRNERINLVLRLLDASAIHYKLDIAKRTLIIY